MHRLPGIHSKQELTLPCELGRPRATHGSLPAKVHLGGIFSRPHPYPREALFAKVLAFSPFMYHGWNPELGKASLGQETARSYQPLNLPFCLCEFLLKYCHGTAHLQVMCKNLPPSASGECLGVCIIFTFATKLKEHFNTCKGSLEHQSCCSGERRVCTSAQTMALPICCSKALGTENESALWFGLPMPELEPS